MEMDEEQEWPEIVIGVFPGDPLWKYTQGGVMKATIDPKLLEEDAEETFGHS